MKKLFLTLATLSLLHQYSQAQQSSIYQTIDRILATTSKTQIKREVKNLADKLGNQNNYAEPQEIKYALDLLVSEDSQRYITSKVYRTPKTLNDLSLQQKIGLQTRYPQIRFILNLRKKYKGVN